MAKPTTVLIKLVSTAGTGYFYTTKKNPRKTTEKLALAQIRPEGAQARRVQGSQDQVGAFAHLWQPRKPAHRAGFSLDRARPAGRVSRP